MGGRYTPSEDKEFTPTCGKATIRPQLIEAAGSNEGWVGEGI